MNLLDPSFSRAIIINSRHSGQVRTEIWYVSVRSTCCASCASTAAVELPETSTARCVRMWMRSQLAGLMGASYHISHSVSGEF